MFGFIENMVKAGVKVVVSPLAVVKDVVDGEPFETTDAVLTSAKEDVEEAFSDLFD